jgi:hypothetical protein
LDCDTKDDHVDQWLRIVQLFDNGRTLKRAAFDLKLYGQCFLNPIWSVDRTQISIVHHLPATHMRVGKVNDRDEVETFYHSTEWDKTGGHRQAIPAFNSQDRESASTVIMIKLYNPLSIYYGLPDYVGSTNYVHLDKSISEFHLNNIENGLFPSMMVSFNNGIPTDEEQMEIERSLYAKFGGATGAKLLLSFNDSADNAPKVEQIRIEDQHKMYDYLSKEVTQKILSGHRVTSPLLFGLRDTGGGFGSNAEEMREAFELFMTTVIQPMQEELLNGIRPILSANSITLDLKFGQFIPAPFLTSQTEDEKKNFSGVIPTHIPEAIGERWLEHLKDKDARLGAEWILLDSQAVIDPRVDRHLHRMKRNFAASESTLASYDNHWAYSEWGDVVSPKGNHFALRYAYSTNDSRPVSKTGISRDFCLKMIDLSAGGVIYRYEDIADMSMDEVNSEFGSYDIFEFKGGVNCYHYWTRQIYVLWMGDEPYTGDDPLIWDDIVADWDEVMVRVANNPYVPQPGIEGIAPIDMGI